MTITSLLQNNVYPQKAVLEKLICHRLWLTKNELFTKSDSIVSSEDYERIHQAYRRYSEDDQPLEYILWKVSFLWVDFIVTPATLIPRPETEYMIEAIWTYIQKTQTSYHLLDIGTWCGVLWLSILHHYGDHIHKAYLADISTEALHVANQNCKKLSAMDARTYPDTVHLQQSNLIQEEKLQDILLRGENTILVANLPYIPDELFDNNTDATVQKREPRMAFVWWDDGLDLYRVMFDQIYALKNRWWKQCTLFLEMMTRQVDILRKSYPDMQFKEVRTFHFNIRIVQARFI